MNVPVLIILFAACAVLFVLERLGVPTTLELTFKGDIKRESRWLAQYGQSVCTPVAALLVWQLDPAEKLRPVILIAAVLAAWYPQAAGTFWALAIICAALRYLLDAHWPSDVLGGCALGYGIAWWVMALFAHAAARA